MPAVDRDIVFKLIEAQIRSGEHFGQHDDLAGVHRNGKRHHNRFPFLFLQTCWIQVDGFLTDSQIGKSVRFSSPQERLLRLELIILSSKLRLAGATSK
jgi:hypothetical protein